MSSLCKYKVRRSNTNNGHTSVNISLTIPIDVLVEGKLANVISYAYLQNNTNKSKGVFDYLSEDYVKVCNKFVITDEYLVDDINRHRKGSNNLSSQILAFMYDPYQVSEKYNKASIELNLTVFCEDANLYRRNTISDAISSAILSKNIYIGTATTGITLHVKTQEVIFEKLSVDLVDLHLPTDRQVCSDDIARIVFRDSTINALYVNYFGANISFFRTTAVLFSSFFYGAAQGYEHSRQYYSVGEVLASFDNGFFVLAKQLPKMFMQNAFNYLEDADEWLRESIGPRHYYGFAELTCTTQNMSARANLLKVRSASCIMVVNVLFERYAIFDTKIDLSEVYYSRFTDNFSDTVFFEKEGFFVTYTPFEYVDNYRPFKCNDLYSSKFFRFRKN